MELLSIESQVIIPIYLAITQQNIIAEGSVEALVSHQGDIPEIGVLTPVGVRIRDAILALNVL